MNLRTLTVSAVAAAVFFAPAAHAQSDLSKAVSTASVLSGAAGLVVVGSTHMIAGASELTVVSVRAVGESTQIVVRGIGNSVEATVEVSTLVARDLSLAAGTVLSVVVESVGVALVAGGKVLAFLPNEVGRALIHQARLK